MVWAAFARVANFATEVCGRDAPQEDGYLRYAGSTNLFHFVGHPLPLCPSKLFVCHPDISTLTYGCCLQPNRVQLALTCALAEPAPPLVAHGCPVSGKPAKRGCRRPWRPQQPKTTGKQQRVERVGTREHRKGSVQTRGPHSLCAPRDTPFAIADALLLVEAECQELLGSVVQES